MADPLSVASGIAGLISLADIVLSRAYKLIVCCKNASATCQKLINEVQSLIGVLKGLESVAQLMSRKSLDTKVSPDLRQQCLRTLESLRDKLPNMSPREATSAFSKIKRTLEWPMKSHEMEEFITELEGNKSTFTLAISIDTLQAIMDAGAAQDELASNVRYLCTQERTKQQREMLEFFGTDDPVPNHEMSVKLRHPDTGLWFTKGSQFQEWLSQRNSKLWVFGIPGAGKTILAGAAITEVMEAAPAQVGVVYYYCDYKKQKSRDAQAILASFAGQLAGQNSQCLELLLKTYLPSSDEGRHISSLPDTDTLVKLVSEMSRNFDEVAFIVNGLDECTNAIEATHLLCNLTNAQNCKFKAAIFSRDEIAIRRQLERSDYAMVSIAAENEDLRLYIYAEIDRRSYGGLVRPLGRLKDEIQDQLIKQAQGMFRWVVCQIDVLCRLPTDSDRRKALRMLPDTLDETYDRVLENIENNEPEATRLLVERVLAWLVSDQRTETEISGIGHIMAPELCQAVAISDSDDEPHLDLEAVPEIEDILHHCGSLVRLSNSGNYIELAHFTVEEYLRKDCGTLTTSLDRYHYRGRIKNLYKIRICLRFICMDHFTEPVSTVEDSELRNLQFPFYSFAARSWPTLASVKEYRREEEMLLQRLFSLDMVPNFQTWLIEVIQHFSRGWKLDEHWAEYEDEDDVITTVTPLHMACLLREEDLVAWLLDHDHDINQTGVLGTPLHCALVGGRDVHILVSHSLIDLVLDYHGNRQASEALVQRLDRTATIVQLTIAFEHNSIRVAKYLLEAGADINEKNHRGRTFLHRYYTIYWANRAQDYRTWFDTLLDNEIDVTAIDNNGDTAIHYCARKGYLVSELTTLLRKVDDWTAADSHGSSLWHILTENDHPKMYEALEAHAQTFTSDVAAALSALDREGLTPFHLAARQSSSIFEKMLVHGRMLEQRSSDGRSILHFAAQGAAHLEQNALELVLGLNYDISCVADDGSNAVHDFIVNMEAGSSHRTWRHSLNMLYEMGVDFTQKRYGGVTPLHLFCQKDFGEVSTEEISSARDTLDYLLEVGADPLDHDEEGRSSLDYLIVTNSGRVGKIRVLIERIMASVPIGNAICFNLGGPYLDETLTDGDRASIDAMLAHRMDVD